MNKKTAKDEGIKILTFGLALNILLMLLKGSVGLVFASQVLTADAVNSAGDVMTTLVVLLGLRYALKPHDEDHHYGHGKMEALVSLFVGIFILVGIGFLAADIYNTLSEGSLARPSFIVLATAGIAIAIKVFMYKKTISVGRKLNSIAIITSAKDYRNDILATSGAVAAIILTFVGSWLDIGWLLRFSEPIMASVIALLIVKTAIEIIVESSKMLLDAAPDKDVVDGIHSIIDDVNGVENTNWVKCRKMGRGLLVDSAIEVKGSLSVEQGHNIGDEVKFAIIAKYPEVIDVVIHINPCCI